VTCGRGHNRVLSLRRLITQRRLLFVFLSPPPAAVLHALLRAAWLPWRR
jgi:hypothetical protein